MPKNIFRRMAKNLFIVANIIVAILFIVACYAHLLNPEKWWFLGLITIGSLYLLAALILFILFWLFSNRKWMFISIITLFITYKQVNNIIPCRFFSSFSEKKQINALRIMSWNVAQFDVKNFKKTHTVFKEMIGIINHEDPDIACFQELVANDSGGVALLKLKTIVDTLQFPYYDYLYDYNENWFDMNMHFGTMIFSKYPIINKQKISHAPFDYNTTFQYCDILKNEDTLRVFNVHLQSLKFTPKIYTYIDEPLNEKAKDIDEGEGILKKMAHGFISRKKQVDYLYNEVIKSPYPVIVCGDFNDVPNSYAYSKIDNVLQNAFVKKGRGIGRTFGEIDPTLRIDNIFVDPNMDVLQFKRIPRLLSDHFPIIADVLLKN